MNPTDPTHPQPHSASGQIEPTESNYSTIPLPSTGAASDSAAQPRKARGAALAILITATAVLSIALVGSAIWNLKLLEARNELESDLAILQEETAQLRQESEARILAVESQLADVSEKLEQQAEAERQRRSKVSAWNATLDEIGASLAPVKNREIRFVQGGAATRKNVESAEEALIDLCLKQVAKARALNDTLREQEFPHADTVADLIDVLQKNYGAWVALNKAYALGGETSPEQKVLEGDGVIVLRSYTSAIQAIAALKQPIEI